MGFLVPAFLAGALAIGIPIWVHLTNKQRKEAVEFPSLMFLERIPFKSEKKQVIRNVLLFAMRVAALILLVAAFSRPFFSGNVRPPSALGNSREVVILVDRSYSMGYGDRWSRALDAAREAIDGLSGSDQGSLVFFDDQAYVAGDPTPDKAALKAHVSTAKLGHKGTKYVPALKVAQKILEETEMGKKEIVLISDFQKVAWDGHEEVLLPEGVAVKTVDLSDEVAENLAVTSVNIHRELREGRDRFTAASRITNSSDTSRRGVKVTLALNGRVIESKTVDLPAKNAVSVNFTSAAVPEGSTQGVVSISNDQLSADDSFHFVISAEQEVGVLIIEDERPVPNQSFFLKGALEIGDRPNFRVELRSASRVRAADLERRSLVILNDAPFPGGELGRQLKEFVSKGGGLFIVAGDKSQARSWVGDAAELLPGKVGNVVQRNPAKGATFASIEFGHPIFELFNAPRSGDFAGVRFFTYRPIQPSDSAKVLAHFDDGAVAMVEGAYGRGRVVVLGVALDGSDASTDLPRHVIFLPFVHQVAKHVASFADSRPWFTVGDVIDVVRQSHGLVTGPAASPDAKATLSASDLVLEGPDGKVAGSGTGQPAGFIELDQQGFYSLRIAGGRTRTLPMAANLDLAESDLSRFEPSELVTSITNRGSKTGRASGLANLTSVEREKRQNIWWYLMVLALMLLAAETLLGNRLSPALRERTS